ncbi:unnamed protein product [Nippostrongylus brasiliensis]|uniref:ShKT domain-containing protein n=1 Tax=Nippostrongylus brasiliensis TaxID=27835 RepID=A0A0N4XPU0_NIPBR|nr:hypothetical protein Q1695_011908 [Nippostrongylus brasiliensis]VDL68131.1 unnamed protein product [Nippostrongylus brasiliensis]
MKLVFFAMALICLVPLSSQKCFSSVDCLPDMDFPGTKLSMRCDIACAKCFRKTFGHCTRFPSKGDCSHICLCSGFPSSASVRPLDKTYCEFVKNSGKISEMSFSDVYW